MKINEITVFSYQVNYSLGSYTMSGGRVTTGEPSIVIRIRTDDGLEGWAETAPVGSTYLPSSFTGELSAVKELAPQILGLDPRSLSVVNQVMDWTMLSGSAAKSVIDCACWDIFGKSVGLPTHALLGGCILEQMRVFAVVGLGDPATGVKKALAEVEKGATAMQLKVGDDPITDARRVKAIREAIPDHVDAWADANANWTLEQAIVFARALGQNLTVPLEQPCRAMSDCIEVGRRTGLPIILDESVVTINDLVAAHTAGVVGINLKPARVGGITKARIMRDAAVSLNMTVAVDDTWGCALVTAQNLQLAASTPANRFRAVDVFAEWTNPLIAEVLRLQSDGRIGRTTLPGNGYGAIDLEVLGEPVFHISA